MTSGVYAIFNTVIGMAYVGSTKKFDTRVRRHRAALRIQQHANKPLQAAWNEHGEPAFSVELLEEVAPDDDLLESAERRWIARLASECPGGLYNQDLTGRRWRVSERCVQGHSDWKINIADGRRRCRQCAKTAAQSPAQIRAASLRGARRIRIQKPKPPRSRTCPVCNRTFIRPGRWIYDSDACQKKADALVHQRKRRQAAERKMDHPRGCPACSTMFIPVGGQIYCSRTCTMKAWHDEQRRLREEQGVIKLTQLQRDILSKLDSGWFLASYPNGQIWAHDADGAPRWRLTTKTANCLVLRGLVSGAGNLTATGRRMVERRHQSTEQRIDERRARRATSGPDGEG